jgi:D-xylonolactonase
MTTAATKPECIWPVAAELGEGALWQPGKNEVWFVDILGQRVHRCDAQGGQRQTWAMPRMVGFVLPLATIGADFIVGLQGTLQRFNPASGQLTHLLDVEANKPDNRINDGHVDAQGRLWFGTMHVRVAQPTGTLYRVAPGGVLSAQDGPYACTNGPADSPDGRVLYHTDTMQQRVYAFDVSASGELSGKRLFASFSQGYPDGMAVDAEGHVWIALYAGRRIERYTAQGRLVQTVALPCDNVTKLAFGGSDLRTAFITTARSGLNEAQLTAQPLAGGLFSFQVDTPGLPQHAIREGFTP